MFISEVVLTIGQEIIVDVLKDIYKDKTLAHKLEKDFKKAILEAVRFELPYEQEAKLISNIANSIFHECKEKKDLDFSLVEIIEKSLIDYGDYNKSSKLLAKGIASNIPIQIIKYRELNALIDSKLAFAILSKNKTILNELGLIKNSIQVSKFENQETREILLELLKLSKELVNNQKVMEVNNKFIPDKYKIYFFNKLFLEEKIADGLTVKLKDVYILPHFVIMDFVNENNLVLAESIIEFIKDFAGENRRNKKYKSSFDFKEKYITTLFIKGHPGSGKSSLFYYLAYLKSHKAEFLTNYRVFFIKLIELYKENNNILSENDPLSDIERHLLLGNKDFNDTILILDGLDEICAARDINIYDYCNNLIASTFRYKNFKIIITTRLNYIEIVYRDNKNVLNVKLENWTIEDLSNWTEKYFTIHNECKLLYKTAISNIMSITV